MTRALTIFILKLALASATLFALWVWQGEATYARFYGALLRALSLDPSSMREAIPIITPRFYNVIPFLSLMLSMWGISARRRILGSPIGLAILIAWHVVFLMIVQSIYNTHQLGPGAYKRLSPWFLLSDVLPWLLWALICQRPLSDLIRRKPAPAKKTGERRG